MATGTINFYTPFKKRLLNKEVDLDTDTFNVWLLTDSYTPAHTHSVTAQITNEVSAGGYAKQALSAVAIAYTGSAVTWDAADCVWTASGAAFTAHYYVIMDAVGPAIYGLIDDSPASVTVDTGNTLTLTWNAGGILKLD